MKLFAMLKNAKPSDDFAVCTEHDLSKRLLEIGDCTVRIFEIPDAPDILTSLVGNSLAEVEKLFIAKTLEMCGGNRAAAANMLGIGERSIYRKINEYGL